MKADPSQHIAGAYDISTKVATLLQRRLKTASDRYAERLSELRSKNLAPLTEQQASSPWDAWQQWSSYLVDGFQRSILFWDTLRTRGNNYIEHERAGKPPLLVFRHEAIVDGRKLTRPVNYALLRILPPEGVQIDDQKRPYVIIDPRAGHGPGIGGFKEDSEVGVALRAGHPVYVVVFFPEPEPNQTLLDVCEAEAHFMHAVRERHPASPKPVVMGNCQGGWAAMMLAASHPDDTGPIVINGAPLSYWAGNFGEGEGENPMRYAGGLLGGSWLAALASDRLPAQLAEHGAAVVVAVQRLPIVGRLLVAWRDASRAETNANTTAGKTTSATIERALSLESWVSPTITPSATPRQAVGRWTYANDRNRSPISRMLSWASRRQSWKPPSQA